MASTDCPSLVRITLNFNVSIVISSVLRSSAEVIRYLEVKCATKDCILSASGFAVLVRVGALQAIESVGNYSDIAGDCSAVVFNWRLLSKRFHNSSSTRSDSIVYHIDADIKYIHIYGLIRTEASAYG